MILDAVLIALILVAAWRKVGKEYRGMSADWLTDAESKGAALGALVAVVNTFRRDGALTSFIRFFTGYAFGFLGADPLIEWLGWESTQPMKLFAGSIIGLVAFVLVQIVLAERTKEIVFGLLRSKSGVKETPAE